MLNNWTDKSVPTNATEAEMHRLISGTDCLGTQGAEPAWVGADIDEDA